MSQLLAESTNLVIKASINLFDLLQSLIGPYGNDVLSGGTVSFLTLGNGLEYAVRTASKSPTIIFNPLRISSNAGFPNSLFANVGDDPSPAPFAPAAACAAAIYDNSFHGWGFAKPFLIAVSRVVLYTSVSSGTGLISVINGVCPAIAFTICSL